MSFLFDFLCVYCFFFLICFFFVSYFKYTSGFLSILLDSVFKWLSLRDIILLAGDDDGDGIPDHLDPDDDNDGIPDIQDDDDDGDGILDKDEGGFQVPNLFLLT